MATLDKLYTKLHTRMVRLLMDLIWIFEGLSLKHCTSYTDVSAQKKNIKNDIIGPCELVRKRLE